MSNVIRELYLGERIIFAAIKQDRTVAAHYWISPNWADPSRSYGGIELHRRPKPGTQADNETCWLLKGPCNHDGSSLYAHETLNPIFHQIVSSGECDYSQIWMLVEKFLTRYEDEG